MCQNCYHLPYLTVGQIIQLVLHFADLLRSLSEASSNSRDSESTLVFFSLASRSALSRFCANCSQTTFSSAKSLSKFSVYSPTLILLLLQWFTFKFFPEISWKCKYLLDYLLKLLMEYKFRLILPSPSDFFFISCTWEVNSDIAQIFSSRTFVGAFFSDSDWVSFENKLKDIFWSLRPPSPNLS